MAGSTFMGLGSKTVPIPFRVDVNQHGSYDDTDPEHPQSSEYETIVYKDIAVGGGDSVYTVYAPCGAAGSAMYDPESREYKIGPVEGLGMVTKPHCWLMYAPPIVIHGDYMSVEQGMRHVNMVHRTSNYTAPVTTNAALSTLGDMA